VQPN